MRFLQLGSFTNMVMVYEREHGDDGETSRATWAGVGELGLIIMAWWFVSGFNDLNDIENLQAIAPLGFQLYNCLSSRAGLKLDLPPKIEARNTFIA